MLASTARSFILRARAREKASAHAKCPRSRARSFEALLISSANRGDLPSTHVWRNPAIRAIVIIFLVVLSVIYFSALPILGHVALAGALINNMSATGPLVLFIVFPRPPI